MKRFFFFMLSALMLSAVSCNDAFDDSLLWEKINNHENRIAALEELCKQMNTNITSLQKIVNALQNNDYVTNVAPITKDGEIIGYTITFTKSDPITIYLGKDGIDGTNGKDGHTPIIGVKQDTDNLYYWTVDGEWLLDSNGNKIKAQSVDGEDGKDGIDGTDGTNGTNGITPRLKIENDYWWVSYDNGSTWEQLDKATGENSDSFFNDVYIENGYVNFILKDQIIKIAYISDETFVLVCKQEGDIQKKLTDAQKRSITHLIVEGYIADSDVRYIGDQMLALEILDLRKTTITKVPDYAFCKGELKYGKESLRKVYLPITCTSIGYHAFYGCINLEYLEAKGDVNFNEQSLLFCDKISLCIASSKFIGNSSSLPTRIKIDTLRFCGTAINNIEHVSINHMIVNNSVTSVHGRDTGYFEGLIINTIEFEEPASISSIDMGFLDDIKVKELTIPTSIKIIKSPVGVINGLKKFIIPQNSQLEKWELNSDTYYLEEIYCYLPTPPTLKIPSNYRFTPIIYVPIENYSTYLSSPTWSKFTIKPIL